MLHVDFIALPLAYISAIFVGWSLRTFKSEKEQVDLEIQIAVLTAALEKTKTRLEAELAELAEAKAEVERLKLKIHTIQNAINEVDSSDDESSDDEMPPLISADE
jgi:chromosome segregation ATPase